MKIISKKHKDKQLRTKYWVILLAFLLTLPSAGCGTAYEIPYSVDSLTSSFRIVNLEETASAAEPFAAQLCVTENNVNQPDINLSNVSGAALFDINGKETLYAKNVHDKLYPASLTKVMTALVALKHGSTDMLLTASSNVTNLEADAQTCGLKEGDQMTLAQALHILLINSANDAAIMVAEGVAGSVEEFSKLMNEEALLLGATNTNFVNPHGLSDDNHYTTVYDLYLIMNEAIRYDLFNEIIGMSSYTTVYYNGNGESKEITVNSTNHFLNGDATAPTGITVHGGKTGTTNAAGHCLILISRDTAGNPYISVILRAESRDDLYIQMSELLTKINN